ncbi:MAG TPA: glycoside hydrolase family 38 C-terminal domain-containing protein [Pseudonocardiaceae bacterium]|nr:glycoside hydrolase family 38 C-terminal domain-containing protein [Pseudonocardiaceae bacterium]
MHDDRALVEGRIDRMLRERIRPAVYGARVPMRIEVWHAPDEPVPVAEALAASYTPTEVGAPWGPPWGTSWFRVSGTVPPSWAGQVVELVVDIGFDSGTPGFQCEGLVYGADGSPVKGIHPDNKWVRLSDPDVLFYVEAAANPIVMENPPFGVTQLGDKATAGTAPLYRTARFDAAVFEPSVAELIADIEVADQLMRQLPVGDARRWELLRALERAMDRLDLRDIPAHADSARAELAEVLSRPAHASAHRLSAVGHAHIDSAWLWPLRETVRKVARTTCNVTSLMDDHPDFVFAMSQAQQLAWMRDQHPEVFERIKAKVKAGQFVPVGGMWVESDTNMPGGEAMARQFAHGKRFFLDEFGVETREVWLPDSFGYSAALPQLVRLSGSDWFLTQKISWSQINKFPHHTFWWEGIDGTRVFTHFPPVDTYNSTFSGWEMAHAASNYAEKGRANTSLMPFGYGDGGGGPTREMLARAARLADLEGSPRVTIEAPGAFFARAAAEYPDAPVWAGELYLEFHRGTYTSQARTKQGNRRSEHLLREAELWSATATVLLGVEYPYDKLDQLWKTVLLNQFHDILPGSSIAWVHREAERTYADVAASLSPLIEATQDLLVGKGSDPIVFNAAPHALGGVPGMGAATAPALTAATPTDSFLDNGFLRVHMDENGLLASVYDVVADRELIAPGQRGNLLQLHPDLPNQWDAWDVDSFYRNVVTDLVAVDSISVSGNSILVARSFGESTVQQTITLPANSAHVEIETEVDWRESEKFLKLAFPLDLHTDRFAAETQFGHVYRPTHANTSWDAAKFEVCAHRWVRLAEPGYGVALVNDSTYGHDVTRSTREGGGTYTTLRASLLRAPKFPDPDTDHGVHKFRHALVAGATVLDAVQAGYRINLPPRTRVGGGGVVPLVAVDNEAVVVESVKLADDRSGDVVVRLYESLGNRAAARLTTAGFPLAGATSTDLLERRWAETTDYDVSGNAIDLSFRPFEIKTIRLQRG